MAVKSALLSKIERECGNINVCFQCRKCSAGCPVAHEMDLLPSQIIHAVRLGMMEQVLKSRTIWLCASCETCTTRCPQEVDIAKVMDSLRAMAVREGIKPAVPQVRAFHASALQSIRMFGRMYELGMLGMMKLRTGEYMKDKDLGMKMLKKGKMKLFPTPKNVFKINRIFSRAKKMEKTE